MMPVATALAARGIRPTLILTGQHSGLAGADFGFGSLDVIDLGCPGEPDSHAHVRRVSNAVRPLLAGGPDLLVVQGDTSSALGGALAANEAGIPLAHVEAGLRTYDPNCPWPEEQNRMTIDRLSSLLFAPTTGNAANLRRDKVAGEIRVTGNSGIDALAELVGPLPLQRKRKWWPKGSFTLLVTCHRRENWGAGLDSLASAILSLAERHVRSEVVLPPNPSVTERLTQLLGGNERVRLVPPLSHEATIAAMCRADLLLSDSGGIQEEAPALGIPLLILRDKTERPEGLSVGCSMLVGTDPGTIVDKVLRLKKDRAALRAMATPCLPFGDGQAASRIARHCLMFLEASAGVEQCRTA